MQNRRLGTTELEISPLGMGTIQMTRLPWSESLNVIRGVHDLGVNWFDTAQGYLDSETLSEHIDASLRRLETDYIEVFFFHGGSVTTAEGFTDPGGPLDTATRFVEQGKIRYLGFSAHRPEVALRALDFPQFRVAMIPANYINREYIDGAFMPKAIEVGSVSTAVRTISISLRSSRRTAPSTTGLPRSMDDPTGVVVYKLLEKRQNY